jgi:hypothetical protein
MGNEMDKTPPSPNDCDFNCVELDQLEWELNNMNGKGVVDPSPDSIAAESAAFERALVELESWACPEDGE